MEANGDLVALKLSPQRGDLPPETIAKIQAQGRIVQLKVQFGSSSLLSTSKQVFAWQLKGKGKDWTFTRDRELIIHNIGPGK